MAQAFLVQAPRNAQDAYQGVNATQVMRLFSQHRSIPQPAGAASPFRVLTEGPAPGFLWAI